MQQQNQQQQISPEARQFYQEQAKQFQEDGNPVRLVTRSEHSTVNGQIKTITAGGVTVLDRDTQQLYAAAWENVQELIQLPRAQGQSQSSGR